MENGEVLLFDWQCVCRGFWARDVAYLLASATPTEFRREHEDEWLRYYLEKLHEGGGPKIAIDEAWQAVSEQLLGALMYWLHVSHALCLTYSLRSTGFDTRPRRHARLDAAQRNHQGEHQAHPLVRLVLLRTQAEFGFSMMDDHDTIGTVKRANGGE